MRNPPSRDRISRTHRGLMPAPRRTVGTLGGSGAAAGTVAASIAAAGLGELGTGTGTVAAVAVVRLGASVGGCVLRGVIGASGPGLTPAAVDSADFVIIR